MNVQLKIKEFVHTNPAKVGSLLFALVYGISWGMGMGSNSSPWWWGAWWSIYYIIFFIFNLKKRNRWTVGLAIITGIITGILLTVFMNYFRKFLISFTI